MKTYIKNITLILFLTSLVGCEDYLSNKYPTDGIVTDNFFKVASAQEIENTVNAIYQPMQRSYMYNLRMWTLDIVAGEGRVGNEAGGNGIETVQLSNFIANADNNGAKELWRGPWAGINRANNVINNIEDAAVTIGSEKLTQYIGEAHFLRALYYFNAVRLFGDVPLILESFKATDNLQVPRTDKELVYETIIEDLKTAAESLPLKYSGKDIGRATSGSALGLLAKVYLTLEDYEATISTIEQLMATGIYSLNEDYKDNFNDLKENGPESLFEVQYEKGSPYPAFDVLGQGAWHNEYMAPLAPVNLGGPWGNFGWFHVYAEFAENFEAGDKRKFVSIFSEGDEYEEWIYDPDVSTTGYNVKKFMCPNYGTTNPMDSPLNFPILRYSDVLLMYAEALNERGRTTEACAPAYGPNEGGPLNRVRARAGLENISGDQVEMREAIRNERRMELAFEGGHRWFDLIRWDNGEYARDFFHRIGKTNFSISKHLLLPVPIDDIDSNPNLLPQNPGY
ncbi:MAG: RagB/SusD family nutrient uptake outer membrane protein [Bacteroides sp.]|nr:RagB/SusD family nutrient uptake outer membrane protein [Bacteroides sp.]